MEERGASVLRNAGHGVNDIYWYILPSLLPVILEQFNLKYGAAGALLSAYLMNIAIFSVLLGKLSDYIPRHRVLGIGFFIASLFLIIAGFMGKLGTFILFLLIAGIGVSSFHPAIYATIDETTTRRHGIVYGMFEFWGASAVLCMFFMHGLLLKKLNYQLIIVLTSIPGLIIGSLYLYYGKLIIAKNPIKVTLNETVCNRELPACLFIIFLIVITFRSLGMIAVINFTPTYLVNEVGLHKSLASYATGIYFLGGLIFIPVAGKLADRWGPLPVLLVATGVFCPLVFFMSVKQPLWALPIFLLLIGGSFEATWPAQNMIIAQIAGNIGKGEAFGYSIAVVSVTSSLSPLFFGVAADRIGLRFSLRAFCIPVMISFLVLLILSRKLSLRDTI